MILLFFFAFIQKTFSAARIPTKRRPNICQVPNDSSIVCQSFCQNLYFGIKSMVDSHYSADEISKRIKTESCYIFEREFPELTTSCNQIADIYYPIFVHLAENNHDSRDACEKMGYCSKLESD